MKGNNPQFSLFRKSVESAFKKTGQPVEFIVDGNPQRLKGFCCRMNLPVPETSGYSFEYRFAESPGVRKRRFLPFFHNSAGNRARKTFSGKELE